MMVTCPKCGFSQPKDRYCANCGVDMEAYEPVSPPIAQRVFKSVLFQGGLIILALVGAFIVMRWEQKKARQDSIAQLDGAQTAQVTLRKLEMPDVPRSGSTAAASPIAEQAYLAAPVSASGSKSGLKPNLKLSLSEGTLDDEQPMAVVPSSPIPAAEVLATGEIDKKINLVYAEVPRPSLNDLLSDAKTLASEGNFSTGTIPEMIKHLQMATKSGYFRTLDSQSDQVIHINQPMIVFKGIRDPLSGQNLGLTLQLTPEQNDEQGLHLLVEVQRNLRNGPGATAGVTEQNFQQDFIIPRDSGAYLAGLLPHRAIEETERQFYNNSGILKVFVSPTYQQGASEFVIFVEAL